MGFTAIANGETGLSVRNKLNSIKDVDNTTDADKPVSTAQAAALALKLSLSGGDMSGAFNEKQWTDIASASTTDIGGANGNFGYITGTTTITALGTAQAGALRQAIFTDVLTLTHNAVSLILLGMTNITTSAGDRAFFRSLGSGNWSLVSYVRENGTSLFDNFNLIYISAAYSPADSTTYYVGIAPTAPQLTDTMVDFNLGYAYRIIGAVVLCWNNTTSGTGELSTLQFRNVTQGTSSSIGTFASNGGTGTVVATTITGLNIEVGAADFGACQVDNPAFATNPVALRYSIILTCVRI